MSKKKIKSRRRRPVAKIRLVGDPILKKVCDDVLPDENIEQIERDMMYVLTGSKHGVGIAANQVGYSKRIIVVRLDGFYHTYINPVIEEFLGKKVDGVEGCLSVPKKFAKVFRFPGIIVTCSNIDEELIFNDFNAVVIQHEIDHLNGICKVADYIPGDEDKT